MPHRAYRFEDVQACATELIPLDEHKNHWLWIHEEEVAVAYAMFSFLCSDGNGKNTMLQCEFNGYGYAGSLREMRHTWWNPNPPEQDEAGYTFYLPLDATIAALTHLKKYFD